MTIDQIKQLDKEAGHHFFEADTMRFFNSRVSSVTFGSYFVTSENGPDNIRAWSVRRLDPETRHVVTVGEFQRYPSLKSALKAAETYYSVSKD